MRFHLALLLSLLLFPCITHAQESWVIDQFSSDITISTDGRIVVKETIAADFGNNPKHGIIRTLPYIYTSEGGRRTYTRVSDFTVLQDGVAAQTDITRQSGYVTVRIGDPDITITGQHVYVISYTVLGALQSYDGFDELYWNVTGNDWDAPIHSADAMIHVPAKILQTSCYFGKRGATTPCDQFEVEGGVAFAAENLPAGEGLTMAVGFEPGVVPIIAVQRPPTILDAVVSPWALGVAIGGSLIGIVLLLRHWYRYGRDRFWRRSHLPGERSDREGKSIPEVVLPLFRHQVVAVEYDSPDNLRPAELGVLMDERADTLDVSATIVDLASRGYLEITEISKKWKFGKSDYQFTRTAKSSAGLMEYEKTLLDGMFTSGQTVNMSDLKNSFYKDLQEVKKLLYKEVVAKQLFPANPSTTRTKYLVVGVIFGAVGAGLFVMVNGLVQGAVALQLFHQLLAGVAMVLDILGVAIVVASFFMPRKTGYGRELYQRGLGYESFISRTEKYRAKFLENEGLFFEVLPYAIMFGVTNKLARAFKEMGLEPPAPTWYHGSGQFHMAAFAADMDTFSSSLGTAMASTPHSSGSGGGGFSGGGFGGGGGSSW